MASGGGSKWDAKSKLYFPDDLELVQRIPSPKLISDARQNKTATGVKIFDLDFKLFLNNFEGCGPWGRVKVGCGADVKFF